MLTLEGLDVLCRYWARAFRYTDDAVLSSTRAGNMFRGFALDYHLGEQIFHDSLAYISLLQASTEAGESVIDLDHQPPWIVTSLRDDLPETITTTGA